MNSCIRFPSNDWTFGHVNGAGPAAIWACCRYDMAVVTLILDQPLQEMPFSLADAHSLSANTAE